MFLYAPAASGFVLILFLESKRAPFDHAETEAEVVCGYSTEYNGPMLLIIFLAEYLHLVISAIHFIIFFIGGWNSFEMVMFLPPIFASYHTINFLGPILVLL